MTECTRSEIIRNGGRVVESVRHGEVYDQLWQTADGQYWSGDDWYSNTTAVLHPTTREEWLLTIAKAKGGSEDRA